MDSEHWDERYRSSERVWSQGPNIWIEQILGDEPPGRALDVGAGEGRNAIWLARRGWNVTAVDFSPVAIAKLAEWAREVGVSDRVTGVVADAVELPDMAHVDVAIVCYLQLPVDQRRASLLSAARLVRPHGRLVVVAHDSSNLTQGSGGPQDPAVLYTAQDVMGDLATSGHGWRAERAHVVARPVPGEPRPARDALVVAVRPAPSADREG